MTIDFVPYKDYVLLSYTPEIEGNFLSDLENRKNQSGSKGRDLKKSFYVDYQLYRNTLSILGDDNLSDGIDEVYYFIVGQVFDGYYKFDKNVLGLEFDLYFEKDIKLDVRFFVKYSGTGHSVFRAFNDFYHNEKLYIVKEKDDESAIDNRLSLFSLKKCIDMIPTQGEMQLYRQSRYTSFLINYLNVEDREQDLNHYVAKRTNKVITSKQCEDSSYVALDIERYKFVLSKLRTMLNNYQLFDEKSWQLEVLKIFRLINPKYIYVGEKIRLRSFITNKVLIPDIVLVDYNGNVDLIEIKTPKPELFYSNQYRNNFVPTRELQGTCLQLQNYLISLSKTSGKTLNSTSFKNKAGIPMDFELKATHPKGFILFGRDDQLDDEKKKTDFQIIRNMYADIIDIITYDDLINRFENIIKALEQTSL